LHRASVLVAIASVSLDPSCELVLCALAALLAAPSMMAKVTALLFMVFS
ncbi:MAG: hypothetical protein ACI89U_000552, partial [Gammaproteobacteria bacterium]